MMALLRCAGCSPAFWVGPWQHTGSLFYWNLAADKTNTIDKENIKVMHMLFSLLVHVLLVPQLYMMVIVTKEKTTLMLQLILVILLLIFTASTQGLLSILKYDKSCQERNTCMHRNWAWFLFLNIVVFVSIILVRLLYNLRWREWLLNIKVLGPILDFLVSRKCRDFQAGVDKRQDRVFFPYETW